MLLIFILMLSILNARALSPWRHGLSICSRRRNLSPSWQVPARHVFRFLASGGETDEVAQVPLDAATVNWSGLRKEAARRLDRATKKVSKKSLKVASGGGEESIRSLANAERERDGLRDLADALESDDSALALEFAATFGVRDAPPVRAPRGPKKKKGAAPNRGPRLPYSTYASESNIEIRVGRSASDNDKLSCDAAHRDGSDWWLHAAGCPGSHVVIRSHDDDLQHADRETVIDAACLAALFSKAVAKPPDDALHEASGKAAVSLTRARYVSKPSGAKPGLVRLNGDIATIRVDLGAQRPRLRRLLATKDA